MKEDRLNLHPYSECEIEQAEEVGRTLAGQTRAAQEAPHNPAGG
jgi:hypothetical protein